MKLSAFGTKLTGESGILQLMDDLGRPFPDGVKPHRLGGGNPARVPQVEQVYRREMERLMGFHDAFEQVISAYDAPQGRHLFLDAVASFFRREYGWPVTPENVAVTNGSQAAFFYLFNLLSGKSPERRTILFPLVPEYIGYADQGIDPGCFVTLPARIEPDGEHLFKYFIDLPLVEEYLAAHPEVAALCVSRPTNPTGNVLTDGEIRSLAALARRYGIPLMIDNAYGTPFPNIIYPDRMYDGTGVEPVPYWDENTILSMSLSKIGLPTLRTGIVIAPPDVIKAVSAVNSIAALASGSLGQVLAEGLIRTGELKKLADNAVRPFYKSRLEKALDWTAEFWTGRNYRLHRCEGALFLWMMMDDLRVSSRDLYFRLKEKGVVVVPGEYFFFGLESGSPEETAWKNHPHRYSCLRINYTGNPDEVRDGLRLIASTSAELRR